MALKVVKGVARATLGNEIAGKTVGEVFAMESEDFLFCKRKDEVSITQGSNSVVMPIDEWLLLCRDMEYFVSMSRFYGNADICPPKGGKRRRSKKKHI